MPVVVPVLMARPPCRNFFRELAIAITHFRFLFSVLIGQNHQGYQNLPSLFPHPAPVASTNRSSQQGAGSSRSTCEPNTNNPRPELHRVSDPSLASSKPLYYVSAARGPASPSAFRLTGRCKQGEPAARFRPRGHCGSGALWFVAVGGRSR